MKNTILICLTCLAFMSFSSTMYAQEDKSKRPSPPAVATGILDGANVSINYSSPAVKGRTVWDVLVPYGKIWRTGANEATVFETDKELMISGAKLPAGKYAFFTIPAESAWTIVFNTDWNQWGAFKYDESKDVFRIKVPVEKSPVFNERMTFVIENNGVNLYWENVKVAFEVGE